MKTVLCYGDSNTWGYEPGTAQRYPAGVRWPGILAQSLGTTFHVIEEALCSRTTVLDDPTRPHRNGLTYLRPCLDSHLPLDLVVLLLGTNDLKHRFGLSAFDIGVNLTMLVTAIQQSGSGLNGKAPPVLVVSPPRIGPLTALADMFAGAEEKAQRLAAVYQNVAAQLHCPFVDSAAVVQTSPVDGVHLDAAQHERLGHHLAEVVRALLA